MSTIDQLRISYISSNYTSFARVAEDYRTALSSICTITRNLDSADIVILHIDPTHWQRVFDMLPFLRKKYVVAYCVWEADRIPEQYLPCLPLINEIWTCSNYCLSSFSIHHPRVFLIPHITRAQADADPISRQTARSLIEHDERYIYFLCSGQLWDTRKNLSQLVTSFQALSQTMPHARLIVKTAYSTVPTWMNYHGVQCLNAMLSEPLMAALYELSHVFVSSHHSEGWGLTLSDAMLRGVPVIATGYSGNLQYMTEDNSYLIRTEERNIEYSDCMWNYTQEMKWGYPDPTHLSHLIKQVYTSLDSDDVADIKRRCRNAKLALKPYDSEHIVRLLVDRLGAISAIA
jgi:glycosyltransferase involved in cell wall biosynthesis